MEFVAAALGGNGGGGGKGKDAGNIEPSVEPSRPASGNGGGGGGGGIAKEASSISVPEDDAAALDEAADKGILGPVRSQSRAEYERERANQHHSENQAKKNKNTPIDDLNIGGFPGGGAPVGFRVGW